MGPIHPHPWDALAARRTEGKAVASFVLGLVSLTCAGAITGLPAIVLGAIARRDIDRSNGQLDGRGLAAGGIVSGLFGTGVGLVVMLWIIGAALTASGPEATAAIAPPIAPSAEAAVPTSPPAPPPGIRSYGSLQVVDLDRSRPLRTQLGEIVQRSRGRTLVLQTFVRSSSACAAVAAALPDARMQRALANVTLVRVDVEEYDRELAIMKVETRTAPWFYKLDAKGIPTDAISADAWEANVPENMAPVLGKFVHRTAPGRHRATR
jgi:hypothetical protein